MKAGKRISARVKWLWEIVIVLLLVLVLRAGECGLAFFAVFIAVQWPFAQFLLTPAADHWFFAGGGRHWPFFLKIDAGARVAFWKMGNDELTLARGLAAAGFAVLSTRAGLWLGGWMKRVQR